MADAFDKIVSRVNRSYFELVVRAEDLSPVNFCIVTAQPTSPVTSSEEVSSTVPVPVPGNTSSNANTDSAEFDS